MVFITFFMFLTLTNIFSENMDLRGALSLSPQAHFSGFDNRIIKPQPKINANAHFYLDFADIMAAGIFAGFNYTWASSVDGGWRYPGFSGLETGAEIIFGLPFIPGSGIGGAASAGWYRYNFTNNMFFLPSVTVFPGYRIISGKDLDFHIEAPFQIYLHKQADLFFSAGLRVRMVFK
jgi:hypothetical protein